MELSILNFTSCFVTDIVTDVAKSSFRTVGVVPFTVDSIRYALVRMSQMSVHTECTCIIMYVVQLYVIFI